MYYSHEKKPPYEFTIDRLLGDGLETVARRYRISRKTAVRWTWDFDTTLLDQIWLRPFLRLWTRRWSKFQYRCSGRAHLGHQISQHIEDIEAEEERIAAQTMQSLCSRQA